MPGPIHEGLVALLTNYPKLAFELAQMCGARLHGGHQEHRRDSSVFQDPGDPSKQFVADGVLLGMAPVDGELVAVDGLVIEIQTTHDGKKLISWLIYRAGVRSRHRCRGWTLVLSPDPEILAQARELFEHEPELCPLLVGRHLIPPIVDPWMARRRPAMTILSAVLHARTSLAAACGRAALIALMEVSPASRQCYLRLVSACLTEEQMSEAAKQLPEEVEIELCKLEMESYLYTRGVRQGREQGRKEGEHHACEAIVATLEAALAERGIQLDAAQRARIRSCNDPALLSRWLLRAASASTADELFSA